jgi:hypothetical protein
MTLIAAPRGAGTSFSVIPVDDEHCLRIGFTSRLDRPFTDQERRAILVERNHVEADGVTRLMRADNDYLIDRAAQKTVTPSGIIPTREQDACATESMGAITDRAAEHLYHADAAIIRYRQMLIAAARNLQEGREPPGLDPHFPIGSIRSEEIIIGPDDDPWLVAAGAGETARPGDRLLAVGARG